MISGPYAPMGGATSPVGAAGPPPIPGPGPVPVVGSGAGATDLSGLIQA